MNAQDTSGPLTTQAVPPPHTSSLRLTPRPPGSQPTEVVVGSVRAALSVSKRGTPGPVVDGHHVTSPLTAPTGGPSHAARSVVTDEVPNHPACEAMRAGRLDHRGTGARRQREGDRLPRQSAIGHARHWAAARASAAGVMRRSRVCIVWGLCLVTLIAGGIAGAGSHSAAEHAPSLPSAAPHTAPPPAGPSAADQPTAADASSTAGLKAYGQLPLSFEANHGQSAAPVQFLSRGLGYTLFLTPTEAVLVLRPPRPAPPAILDSPATAAASAATGPAVPPISGSRLLHAERAWPGGHAPEDGGTHAPGRRQPRPSGGRAGPPARQGPLPDGPCIQLAHADSDVRQGAVPRGVWGDRPGLLREPAPT